MPPGTRHRPKVIAPQETHIPGSIPGPRNLPTSAAETNQSKFSRSGRDEAIFIADQELAFRDGVVEENDGSPLVDDLYYYAHNPDVWKDHVDADAHYAQFGWKEGRAFGDHAPAATDPVGPDDVPVDPLHYALLHLA